MSQLLLHPAFWGFWSAFVYAGTTLSRGLWSAEPPADAAAALRQRKLLISSFVLAMVFGPLAAEVGTADLTTWLTARLGYPPAARAVAVGIGLIAAPMWPFALRLVQHLAELKLLGVAGDIITALKAIKANKDKDKDPQP